MPQARIAAISESALSREKTSTDETRSEIGTDHCSVSGSDTMQNSPTRDIDTPSMMKEAICTRRLIVSTNDRTRNASTKLAKNDPNTYLSIVFKTSARSSSSCPRGEPRHRP